MNIEILQGDCVNKLKELPDASVQCCVTSPPYWGLRDYGTANWLGGNTDCEHSKPRALGKSTLGASKGIGSMESAKRRELSCPVPYKKICGKCGAIREDDQLGLESTPEEYVENMVQVFWEVHRVLRDVGTLWLNLGDSYGKEKQLAGIPWRVAFALQADGWYLRQDIIWHKPNPMPESVTDRCTKAHEYVFLLSKNKKYYYEHEAIKEDAAYAGQSRGGSTNRYEQNEAGMDNKEYDKRNKRSVWTIAAKPFKGAHFATFPPDLIEPCILAGCPKGGIVLDPFAGAGTTGLVAKRFGCGFIGIELNPEYAEMARTRIENEQNVLF